MDIREWTGLEFAKSQKAVENREKNGETGCKIIFGTPTTLAVKGLMMVMIMNIFTVIGFYVFFFLCDWCECVYECALCHNTILVHLSLGNKVVLCLC